MSDSEMSDSDIVFERTNVVETKNVHPMVDQTEMFKKNEKNTTV